MTKVYVGGFKHTMNEIDLVKLFMPFGQVSTIKMVRDKKTRVSKGFAFIEMLDRAAAEEAVKALDGWPIGEQRQLKASITEEETIVAPKQQRTFSPNFVAANYRKLEKPGDPVKNKRPRRTM